MKQIDKFFKSFFDDFTINRTLTDDILGQDTSLEIENKVCNALGYKDYRALPEELRKKMPQLLSMIMESNVVMIYRTMKYAQKEISP